MTTPGWKPPLPKKNIFTPQQAYPAAIETQAGDYDDMMARYKNIYDTATVNNARDNTIPGLTSSYTSMMNSPGGSYTAAQTGYGNTGRVDSSIGRLGELSRTGGLSSTEQGDLRARAISPIRSIYSSAQRGLDRQKSLSGGYAPGNAAASTRMAREMSDTIAGHTTNANAEVAKMVQAGKLQAAPQYAQAAAGEAGRKSNIDLSNTSAKNAASQFNVSNKANMMQAGASGLERLAGMKQQSIAPQMDALAGMKSLYGTTPALSNTYGNQAIQVEQLNQKQPKIKRKTRGVKFHLPGR